MYAYHTNLYIYFLQEIITSHSHYTGKSGLAAGTKVRSNAFPVTVFRRKGIPKFPVTVFGHKGIPKFPITVFGHKGIPKFPQTMTN